MKGEEVVSNNMVNMGEWRIGQKYIVRNFEENNIWVNEIGKLVIELNIFVIYNLFQDMFDQYHFVLNPI